MELTTWTIFGLRLAVLLLSVETALPCLGQQAPAGRASAESNASTHPMEYAVGGRLTWEPGKPTRAASSSFSVMVSGEKWMIRIVPDDAGALLAPFGAGGKAVVKDFEVASYDGKWFYLVHSYESAKDISPRSEQAASGWRVGSNHPASRPVPSSLHCGLSMHPPGILPNAPATHYTPCARTGRNPQLVDRWFKVNGSYQQRRRFCLFPWM